MKNWNAPVAEELDIKLTANGIFSCNKEVCIFTHPGKVDDNNNNNAVVDDKDKDQNS